MKLSPITKRNKRGQFESALLGVITIFIIAVIVFFFNHMNKQVYSSLDSYLQDNYNDSQAQKVAEDLDSIEGSNIWDYLVLAGYIGILIQMTVLSFASRTNIIFFWIFILLGIVILVVGTVLSNIWIEIAANPEFSTTITRFTITDTLLGSKFPLVITGTIFFMMLILFGKFPGQEQ